MKKMLTLAAAVVTALTLFAPSADAAPGFHGKSSRKFIGHDRYGNDLYRVTYVAGRDCHGHLIFRSRTEVVKCWSARPSRGRDVCDSRGGRWDSRDGRDGRFGGHR